MKTHTVKEMWDRFANMVIPPDASEVQYLEMRRAFYAGATAMLGICTDVTEDDADEEEAVNVLNACDCELRAFAIAVQEGRA